jgi:type I restriction enzyme M protein
VGLPENTNIGQKINEVMEAIEAESEMLTGALPKEYTRFEKRLLRTLLRIFNREALKTASGDVFGRIYEYFLNKFAMTGAQEGGEFFTPPSLVRTIVNVIEPSHGTVFDPACGSAGMFVQTGYFLERLGKTATDVTMFYGQEKSDTNTRLARMNMAVHGLEAKIIQGNTFYEDQHELVGKCDFVMSNPPFNVDTVNPEAIKNDPRLFTKKKIPGVAKKTGGVSNANYLWIQYYYSYLKEGGRAGFVMASSASDAGHGEKEIRQEIIQTGAVDVMIAIGTNFFYTRSLPCTLWFFDRGKPAERQDQVLMIDARNIYRVISRKIRDFSDEQLQNIGAIIWLYRDEQQRYLELVCNYLTQTHRHAIQIEAGVTALDQSLDCLTAALVAFDKVVRPDEEQEITAEAIIAFREALAEQAEAVAAFRAERADLLADLKRHLAWFARQSGHLASNAEQQACRERFAPFEARLKALQRHVGEITKLTLRAVEMAEKNLNTRKHNAQAWDGKAVREARETLESRREMAIATIKDTLYFFHQVTWLHHRFPKAEYTDVLGLCKAVTRAEIDQHDSSLTPGRYVGVAPPEFDGGEEFEERLTEIHIELEGLNEEATELAAQIRENLTTILEQI